MMGMQIFFQAGSLPQYQKFHGMWTTQSVLTEVGASTMYNNSSADTGHRVLSQVTALVPPRSSRSGVLAVNSVGLDRVCISSLLLVK